MRHSSLLLVLIPALICLPTFAGAAWHPDGNHITYAPGYEFLNVLVSDQSGGGIMFWSDPYQGGIRAQRVSGMGIVQWPIDGMIVLPPNAGNGAVAASDGAGGTFVVWETAAPGPGFEPTLRMQHFDASGAPVWAPGGVFIANIYNYALTVVIEDQAGGAIAIFQDLRPGQNNQLYGQRVDAAGTTLWGTNGIPLVVLPVGQSWQVMQVWHSIASDGAGGVVVAWEDFRNQTTHDIYAQRLSPSGQRLWGDEAVLLHPTPGAQRDPSLATDGAGGAFVAWNDQRNGGGDVYAQHVDATGAIQWGSEGLAVGLQWPYEWYASAAADGAGGVFVMCTDMRNQTYDKYVQRYNAAGEAQWTPGGVAPSNLLGDRGIFAVIPDEQGGAMLGFTQWGEIRAQKLSPSGTRAFGDNGILIGEGSSARGITDGAGGMITAWNRGVGAENVDIFAQRITASGSIPTGVDAPARSATLFVRDIYPNPFAGATTLEIETAAPSNIRVAVFDVAGRRVRDMSLPASTSSQRVEFDGRDDSGKLLASGVYFCRIEARGETVTRKMVITR